MSNPRAEEERMAGGQHRPSKAFAFLAQTNSGLRGFHGLIHQAKEYVPGFQQIGSQEPLF